MKIKLFFFTIIAMLSLGAMFLANASLMETNNNLNNQLQQQEKIHSGKIDELTAYQENLVARISLLENNYSNLQVAYEELVEVYNKYITDSTLEREQLQATIISLNSTISQLEQNADIDGEIITELQAQVTALEHSLNNQTTTITELQSTVAQQEATIEELNTRIDILVNELNSDLLLFDDLVSGNITEVTADMFGNITEIRPYAFYKCLNLTSVSLPITVVAIKSSAFQYCANLQFVDLKNVVDIESFAFGDCTNLETVNHNGKISTIGNSVFRGSGLVNFEFYEGITKIGNYCFYNTKLNHEILNLPSTLDTVEHSAFSNTNIISVDLSNTKLTTLANDVFSHCTSLKSCILPQTCKYISDRVFFGCISLSSINLPDSIVSIGIYAFSQTALSDFTISANCTSISCSAFLECRVLQTMYIPLLENITFVSITSTSASLVFNTPVRIYTASSEIPEGYNEYWNYTSHTSKAPVYLNYTYEQYLEEISA